MGDCSADAGLCQKTWHGNEGSEMWYVAIMALFNFKLNFQHVIQCLQAEVQDAGLGRCMHLLSMSLLGTWKVLSHCVWLLGMLHGNTPPFNMHAYIPPYIRYLDDDYLGSIV